MTEALKSQLETLSQKVLNSSEDELINHIEIFVNETDKLLSQGNLSFEETQYLKEVHDRVTAFVDSKKSAVKGSMSALAVKSKGLKAYLHEAQNKSTSKKG